MKRILIIHTGGTFGMMPMKPSQTLAPSDIQDQILKYVPEINQIARIETIIPFNIDSSNITIEHWQKLAEIVDREQDNYDGFVVVHGTDTMAYSASALSFMIRNVKRPVIFTGAQRPLAEIRTDARTNLVNSVELATMDIREVAVFFGYRLFRGNRVTKVSVSRYDAFESPNFPALAEVGIDIKINKNIQQSERKYKKFTEFSRRVGVLTLFPGISNQTIQYILNNPDVDAIVIQAFGAGNVPIQNSNLVPSVERAVKDGKIIAVGTQATHGKVSLDMYDCGKKIMDVGAIPCLDMTLEASVTKLMYLLGKHSGRAKVIERFTRNIAGELSKE